MPIPGSEFTVPADTVIVAVSQSPNPLLAQTEPRLKQHSDGRLVMDPETMQTTVPGVFAGGDIANDAGTVIAAMGDGKRAAEAIDDYLRRKHSSRSGAEEEKDPPARESKTET